MINNGGADEVHLANENNSEFIAPSAANSLNGLHAGTEDKKKHFFGLKQPLLKTQTHRKFWKTLTLAGHYA